MYTVQGHTRTTDQSIHLSYTSELEARITFSYYKSQCIWIELVDSDGKVVLSK